MTFRTLALSLSTCGLLAAASTQKTVPTFNKEVAPIIQKNCQGCHRPGEAAPFSLLTYKEARPWAASIKEAVRLKKMPPWGADSHYGKFANDRSMSQHDIDTVVAWASNGAPEGKAKDMPAPVRFIDGWNIGTPDAKITMSAKFEVAAKGTIDYQHILMPMNLKEDVWVQAAEIRPGDRAHLHHVIAYVRQPGSTWMKDAKPGVPWIPKDPKDANMQNAEYLVGYAPGLPPMVLPEGRSKLLQAGSDIVLELHYTANGSAGLDQTSVGLLFSKTPVKERVYTLAASNSKFAIPAGDSNYEVVSKAEMATDLKLTLLGPHMHVRGKDFLIRAVYPTGESQVLLNVPKYDFNWQTWYQPSQDVVLPKGSRIECVAHFDNSANNPNNPDPTKTVRWGDQSWEEMMIGFFDVAIDPKMDTKKLLAPPKREPKKEVAAALE